MHAPDATRPSESLYLSRSVATLEVSTRRVVSEAVRTRRQLEAGHDQRLHWRVASAVKGAAVAEGTLDGAGERGTMEAGYAIMTTRTEAVCSNGVLHPSRIPCSAPSVRGCGS